MALADGDVWISKFFDEETHLRGDKVDWKAPGWRDVAINRLPPPETLPLPVYAEYKTDTQSDFLNLPPIATGGGGIYVNRALAEVFRHFDLVEGPGENGAIPIQFFLYDRTTPVEADYYALLYGGQRKDGLIPEESKGLREDKLTTNPRAKWHLMNIKDGDIAVRSTVRSGADFWGDTNLMSALFLSDRLVQALTDAGARKYFNPIRCRVIEFN
jgi:hypothetical protein